MGKELGSGPFGEEPHQPSEEIQELANRIVDNTIFIQDLPRNHFTGELEPIKPMDIAEVSGILRRQLPYVIEALNEFRSSLEPKHLEENPSQDQLSSQSPNDSPLDSGI